MIQALHATGFQAVVMHFRGCSGEPNLLLRRYHAGETQDLTEVMADLRHRFPQRAIYAIGYSLGGNVLLKWLGETARPDSLSGAIAISVPFSLGEVTLRLNRGLSRLYRRYLLNRLIASTRHKTSMPGFPLDSKSLLRLPDIRSFDEQVTAPLHGFASADDYYQRSSCRQYLKTITVPTLILHALDDPFMTSQAVPNQDELAEAVELEVSARGGHVGFVSGGSPWKPRYWLESRILDWLRERTGTTEKKELPDFNRRT
jgi:predicted alpha/beta-fold hydrolase